MNYVDKEKIAKAIKNIVDKDAPTKYFQQECKFLPLYRS